MEQTIIQRLKRPIIYTPKEEKELWVKYHSWGKAASTEKLLEFAYSRGWFSPEKGKPSRMAPYVAMWRWAFKNPKEAYPHWELWAKDQMDSFIKLGIEISPATFIHEIERHVSGSSIRSSSRVATWKQEWLEKLPEWEKEWKANKKA